MLVFLSLVVPWESLVKIGCRRCCIKMSSLRRVRGVTFCTRHGGDRDGQGYWGFIHFPACLVGVPPKRSCIYLAPLTIQCNSTDAYIQRHDGSQAQKENPISSRWMQKKMIAFHSCAHQNDTDSKWACFTMSFSGNSL